jgi:glycosyltransferase involved in cell wall biosynthesis
MGPSELADAIVRKFEPQLQERFAKCGLAWDGQLPTNGLRPSRTPSFLTSRERVLHDGPEMTIAVCTRDRPEGLSFLLESLSVQEYQRIRVLVVDNAPSDDRGHQVVLSARKHPLDVDYVIEPRPGLSWARNRAIDASEGEVIAWADDDERCDRWWAAELARGFVEVPEAAAVTGIMIPGELTTKSQAWFEEYSGVGRGRGFARAVFSPETARRQSPLYPLPPFGTGGNMAFRRDVLKSIGGFDCALGAGTVTCGGEDTAALSTVLLAGGTIVYQPTAIVHHYHRKDYRALRSHLRGYGRGLTSFYTSMLVHRPGGTAELLRVAGQAALDHFSRRGRQFSQLSDDFPRELLWANRIGLLQGPFTYVAAQVHARRLRRATQGR